MSWITARRRRRVAGYAVIPLGLAAIGVMYASLTGPGQAAASAPAASQQNVARGRYLFEQSCSSCHGLDAQGTSVGPSLIGTGAASVDFQMSTGRMPAKEQGAEMDRRPVVFSPRDIDAVASYVASLGGGPPVPTEAQASPVGANSGLGQQIFNANCAACHNFVGAGGALTNGKYAPSLTQATPVQIYEAMLTGPEAMPAFSDTTLTPEREARHHRLRHQDPRGAEPRRVQPGPGRSGYRGARDLDRRHRPADLRGHMDRRKAARRMSEDDQTPAAQPGREAAGQEPARPHRVIGTPPPAVARSMLGGGPRHQRPADPARHRGRRRSRRPAARDRAC